MSAPIRADDVEPENVEWLWLDRIPRGMITVIGGRPEQGKGLLMAYLAAYVSRLRIEDPTQEKGYRRGQVLYSAVEDSHSLMTVPRLRAAGAIMDNIFLWKFRVPEHQHEMEAHVLERRIDLVIMDPVAAHLGKGVSRHSDSIRDVLTPLSEFADSAPTRPAIVMVEHVLKRFNRNAHPLTAIGGTGSGLPAASRMAFIFGKDPDDDERRVMCAVKNNIRDTPKALVFEVDTASVEELDSDLPMLNAPTEEEWDPIRLLVNDSAGHRHSTIGRPADKREAAAEWLTNYLWENYRGVGAPSGKVFEDAKHLGMTTKTLRRAAADLEIVKNPPGGGPKVTWSLGQDIIDALTAASTDEDEVVDAETGEVLMTEEDFEALLAAGRPASEDSALGRPIGQSADDEDDKTDD